MTDFIISDIHVPYQDEASMSIMMKMVGHFKPKNVIINGDGLDCVQLSRFNRDPLPPSSFKAHVEEMSDIIHDLQRYSNVVFVEGNHEARLSKYINENAPELHGLMSMESLINDNLDEDIIYIRTTPAESMTMWHDDLMIGHFNKAAKYTCYTVKALVERFQQNVVQGHSHRLGEYAIRGQKGIIRGWECGCMCDLNPSYTLLPNWMNGFLIYTRTQNEWNIEIVHIEDEKCMFRGKVYRP